ncbi:GNAT family N-acetyltransferase [Nonomuraea sp. K274]|uniref:GNAT family N-acetyltransferase n=1 Tax=Nonomuraea cypriaca TaxID=1187855 RepID=A0A931AEK9_9ACTN|nr:GNAT family N-acetyltransferase [Nonomuraea cypriaca]MBF8190170.1 GNAT family N-acetyltransferase [Nonomuraea cypriaca]
MRTDLIWPDTADEALLSALHRVLHAVVAAGGAVGYLDPPGREESDPWVEETLKAVRDGDARLAVARVDGTVQGMGLWRRGAAPIFTHSAELGKIMAHPEARGLGLGRLVVSALVDSARSAGIETMTLGVRGNNHGAIGLYESLGFREWGRLPNRIEVGRRRFDDVRMLLELGRPTDVILHGSEPGGPGWSPKIT